MSIDLNGEWIFVSRFLHPLEPPEELLTANKESLETLVSVLLYFNLHFLMISLKIRFLFLYVSL